MKKSVVREKFRNEVFERDNHVCVICGHLAQDAHHIIDRDLFFDGGYVIDNGASLCSNCHILAENCTLTVEDIRDKAGITNIILPESFYSNVKYNKWGQPIMLIDNVENTIMNLSIKYPRTYHYPWSPGAKNDDRINHDWWSNLMDIPDIIHTEKLDGENNCLNQYGVFARSHATPSTTPWTSKLREKWEWIKSDLGDLELFGENVYAVHSIEYRDLSSNFYLFAVRQNDMWLSWEEVKFYSEFFDFPTVPIVDSTSHGTCQECFVEHIKKLTNQNSTFGSVDPVTGDWCNMEGIVTRNINEFTTDDFVSNVFKWVRKDHVQTDEHWRKNWKKAHINYR